MMRGDGEMQKTVNDGAALNSKDVSSQLIHDEIHAIVADAVSSKQLLRVGPHVKRLRATYPGSKWSQRRIANELILVAVQARLPLEIDRL
jgi:hypothetical protein